MLVIITKQGASRYRIYRLLPAAHRILRCHFKSPLGWQRTESGNGKFCRPEKFAGSGI